jgi:hypothetical protein
MDGIVVDLAAAAALTRLPNAVSNLKRPPGLPAAMCRPFEAPGNGDDSELNKCYPSCEQGTGPRDLS